MSATGAATSAVCARVRVARLPALLALLALAALSSAVFAQERILAYDSEVRVDANAGLEVVERITVRAEGEAIRRGIYRDFPTRYRDRYGNRVVVGFEVIEVLRDGRPEPWFSERVDNGVRVNTGDDDLLPVPATYTYTLRYRTTRQLGFFAGHDELYWNAIGHGWAFPIERGSVEVRLPQPVPPAQMTAEGYSGAFGARGRDFVAGVPAPGVARWALTRPLSPQEGLTIALSFPKGVVAAPTREQRLRWLLHDNRGVLIALAALLVLIGYCALRWHRVGRDPPAGTVIVRYEPPAGHSPGGLRYMTRMAYDTRCLTADVLASAVAGMLRIERDDGLLEDRWRLTRSDGGDDRGIDTAEQRALLAALFAGAQTVALDKNNAGLMQKAIAQHGKVLAQRFQPALFERNGGSIAVALLIAVLGGFAAFAGSGGSGTLLILGVCALMVAVLAAFVILVKAPTIAGRRLLDEIAGFKRYLSVAERDDLARVAAPDAAADAPALDAERFERLLPYAVALEVEDAWTEKFTRAVGAAAAAQATSAIAWYHGSGRGDLGGLSQALGRGLSAQIASSATPPGSSSGGGGGGFSGGGGGGGGGGGR